MDVIRITRSLSRLECFSAAFRSLEKLCCTGIIGVKAVTIIIWCMLKMYTNTIYKQDRARLLNKYL